VGLPTDISVGWHDDELTEVIEAAKQRLSDLGRSYEAKDGDFDAAKLVAGDHARLNATCNPKYVRGLEVEVRRQLTKNYQVEIVDKHLLPSQRYARPFRCPPDCLEAV
jgi:hypothetical protein